MHRIAIFFVLLSFGCSSSDELTSSNIFIGTWEYTEEVYLCFNSSSENYLTDCDQSGETITSIFTFFSDGTCTRTREGFDEEELNWCFNSYTNILIIKSGPRDFLSVDKRIEITKKEENRLESNSLSNDFLLRIVNFRRI